MNDRSDRARCPAGLGKAGQAVWRAVTGDYDLTDPELRVLEQASIAADRAAEARVAIERDGAYVDGRYGPRQHPAIAVERDSRAALLRALKDLNVIDRPAPKHRDDHTPGPKPWR
jgi:hypothetical protein